MNKPRRRNWTVKLRKPAGAVAAPMPAAIKPQLATAARRSPPGPGWSYEIKFDGYRFLGRCEDGEARLFTREGHDWSAKLQRQCESLALAPLQSVWLDGEMVCLDANGLPTFGGLQQAFARRKTSTVVYFAFDLLYLDGYDLREVAHAERRTLLAEVVEAIDSELVRFSHAFPHDASDILAAARELSLEGVVGKRDDAPYRSGRTTAWVKLKCNLRQEFVIGGFTAGRRAQARIRDLMLGVYDQSGLQYVGKVPASLPSRALRELEGLLRSRVASGSAYANASSVERSGAHHWVTPDTVVEVKFQEWTRSGKIRHPVLLGLRLDKPAGEVVRERVVEVEK